MMVQWHEIVEINGLYLSKSMYVLVNFRGVTPLFIHAVWDLKVPPKFRCFCGCFHKTKLRVEIILEKEEFQNPWNVIFCKEFDSFDHLFFECIIARNPWGIVIFNRS
jgi:hypothetical protein